MTSDERRIEAIRELLLDRSYRDTMQLAASSYGNTHFLVGEIDRLRAALAASEARCAALQQAGERLWGELQDAAFGYEGVHWKVQRDAPEALDAWRALAPSGEREGE